MKKKYNNVEISFVVIPSMDIITSSPVAEVYNDRGVTGGHALAPDRGFDTYDDYNAY